MSHSPVTWLRTRAPISRSVRPPDSPVICPPPGEELERWLALVIPGGAPAYWVGAMEVPITGTVLAAPAASAASELPSWLTEEERAELQQRFPASTVGAALLRAGVEQPRVRLALMRMLAPEPIRRDGLPAAWHGRRRGSHVGAMLSLEGAPRLGRPGQAIRVAVEWDLLAHSSEVLSEALGLHEHEQFQRGGSFAVDPRRLRAYRSEGRHLLHALGAWPWTHAGPGRLAKRWWERDEFLVPLEAWHREHIADARADADFREAAFRGQRLWGRRGFAA